MTERDDRVFLGLYGPKNFFGDKRIPAILAAPRDDPLRPVEILSTVNSYSIVENWTDKHAVLHDSILARTLKKMREQGLIVRESCDKSFPPEVAYSLTPAIAEVLTLAEPLIEWTRAHPELLSQAQAHSRHSGAETSILDDLADLDSPAGAGRFHPTDRRPRAGGTVGWLTPRARPSAGFIPLGCACGRLVRVHRGHRSSCPSPGMNSLKAGWPRMTESPAVSRHVHAGQVR